MRSAPGSLIVLRTPSALIAGTTTVLSALIARELGGGPRAQVIAAACAASSGFALAVAHLVSTTTFDLVSTTVLGWLAIRAVMRGGGQSLLAAGLGRGPRCRGQAAGGSGGAGDGGVAARRRPAGAASVSLGGGGCDRCGRARAPVRGLAAAARLAPADRGAQHRRESGGWAGRLLPVPARDGQSGAGAGLGGGPAGAVPARADGVS